MIARTHAGGETEATPDPPAAGKAGDAEILRERARPRDDGDHLQAARAKTGRGRVLRCGQSPELVAVLERRLAARRLDSPLIFHNGEGRHVGNFSTSWGRALRRAKVAFTFHDLRRTAVRNMIRAGVPERVAMEISGHQTRAIFDRYNIVSGRDLDDAMAKRAAYEEQMSKAKARANASKEPVTFPSEFAKR